MTHRPPPSLHDELITSAPVRGALDVAEGAARSLRAAGIPVGSVQGPLAGVFDAYVRGLVAHDPLTLTLDPWPFLATCAYTGTGAVVIPVCALRAEEAAELTGLELLGALEERDVVVALRACPITSFVGALAEDRGMDVRAFLRSAAPSDAAALALIRAGTDHYLPGILPGDPTACALRHLPELTDVEVLAIVMALARPGSERESTLAEFLSRGPMRWSWPAASLFDGYFPESAGLPVWQEQMDALLVSLLGASPVDAPMLRALWHRGDPGFHDILRALVGSLLAMGFAQDVVARLVVELDRRNRATVLRATMVPRSLSTIACARALIDDPRGYAYRARRLNDALEAVKSLG